MFIATLHKDSDVPLAASDGAECMASGEATLHVLSFSAIQIAAIVVGLALAISLSAPDDFSARIDPCSIQLASPDLPQLDPPSKTR